MRIRQALRHIAVFIAAVAIALNLYIYNYDLLDQRCQWPDRQADIRLLAFGDPQIRGIGSWTPYRMRVDIHGNDFYLGHIYRVMTWRLKPSHVAVMGDLFSSQWIPDDEFFRRVERYKNRIFRHSSEPPMMINVSGNHDIGYAGEITHERIARYEQVFGKVNYVRDFENWRLVVLNSLALDGPSYLPDYHTDTQRFLQELRESNNDKATVLLTHVPLVKPWGICKDGPQFVYYEHGTLHQQNHISKDMSDLVLNSIFGPGNPHGGIILTGHDHEGCESVYEWSDDEGWTSHKYEEGRQYRPGYLKEATVRAMMGEFGGNTGIMSGTYNETTKSWNFEYRLCRFAVQHVWWVTQVTTLIAVLAMSIMFVLIR